MRVRGHTIEPGADLRGAFLFGADLSNADLSGADLSNAILRGADLSGADLRGADLSGAFLRRANLRGAALSGAALNNANLRYADLDDTDLIDAGQDSRGYRFVAQQRDGTIYVLAGCRYFSLAEAQKHWAERHCGTSLQSECLSKLEHIERIAKERGWIS